MNNEKIKEGGINNFKKSSNKNLILTALGIIILIILIIFSLISRRKGDTEIPTYQLTEESKPAIDQPTEDFSNIDIDNDGKEEQVPREIVESKILMLTDKNKLYIISPIDKVKKLLVDGVSAYASSNNKNYIAYLKSSPFITDETKSDQDIHIYNLSTKQESIIPAGLSAQRKIFWSPDDRYVIVDRGTGGTGTNTVYSFESGKSNGCNFSGEVLWVSNIEALVPLYSTDPALNRAGAYKARGIRKINIENCQSENLILPISTANFYPVRLVNNQVLILKNYVDKPEDWSDFSEGSKIKTTYEKFDLQTRQVTPYPEYADELLAETKRLKSLVPSSTNAKDVYTSEKDPVTDWNLINAHKGLSIYNNDVYLIGPDKTVVKIGENAVATWL